jgi:ribosomal protein S18 acetylase RimI-like enzyme
MDIPFAAEGYRLREAFRSERPYILGCVKRSIIGSVSGGEAKMSELWADQTLNVVNAYMDSIVSRNIVYILEWNDAQKTGMMWLEHSRDQFTSDDTGYLLGIYVEEEFRGMGLGKAMIESAESWCRERGLLSLTLNVGFHNAGARELYDRLGFRTRSTVMRKDLPRILSSSRP